MTRKKGPTVTERELFDALNHLAADIKLAAANPAACPSCGFPSLEQWPREHEIQLHEHIRKLEAELAAARAELARIGEVGSVLGLQAELADMKGGGR